jgi:parvulin-like peptidyl-prolyl isomerase
MEELTPEEIAQINIEEQNRIDDLKQRYESLKDHNVTMASLHIQNGLLYFTKQILGNSDKADAEAKMKEIEDADRVKDIEYQAIKYKDQRQKEYPSIQDQLDMLFHDKQNGTTTFEDAISLVKAKYPKP